jgi:hypothetical protein
VTYGDAHRREPRVPEAAGRPRMSANTVRSMLTVGALTVSETDVLWMADVPVPTTVSGIVPAAVKIEGEIVIVAVSPALMVEGVNEALAP